ncbi:MAG: nuclear transport factor 2 family protein [Methanomicrobiaceae archaeon]|nr:nuclear transport factor 2 family protein [Methanomicrobiaceae archaeon]
MIISIQTREQVESILRALQDAYSARDTDGVMALVAPGFVGYGSGEKVPSAEEYRDHLSREFSPCDTLSLTLSDLHIGASGTVAWILADATVTAGTGGVTHRYAGRLTMVLVGTGHTWKFVQSHFSLPEQKE